MIARISSLDSPALDPGDIRLYFSCSIMTVGSLVGKIVLSRIVLYNTNMDVLTARHRALQLLSEAPAAYLTTIDRDGWPNTRAMLNLRNAAAYPGLVPVFSPYQEDLTLYFTTNTSSGKVTQIAQNQKASAYFCNPSQWQGLMLGGKISLVSDPAIKQKIWQKDWTMYYPGGEGDPDYAILSLKPRVSNYYEYLDSVTWEPITGP